jgi:hypothetical protein
MRVLLVFAALAATTALGLFLVVRGASNPLPSSALGPAADALAHDLERAVNLPAWNATRAVRFFYAGRNRHLWDRDRSYARVAFGETTVWIDLTSKRGVARDGSEELTGGALDEALERAYAAWINDTFWLNPLVKLFDDGVERSLAQAEDGSEALKVAYSSGGLTPGDVYVWYRKPGAALPDRWRMWVSSLTVKGLEATWEEWQTLSTGALIATKHVIGPRTLLITELEGARSLAELEPGDDPFAALTRSR